MSEEEAVLGCLLGTALGDAIGLPGEGLSQRRLRLQFGPLEGHRWLFGWGMISDDTEHACLVAQALAGSGGEVEEFRRLLAGGLRWWLLSLPPGIGLATLRGVLRLWTGISPERSGVYSAGNGPAMRSALLGVNSERSMEQLRELVRASTRLTHTDPKAEWAAYAVALAARMAVAGAVAPGAFHQVLRLHLGAEAAEFLALTEAVVRSVGRGETTEEFTESMGWGAGPSGYCLQSVPVALHAWLAHQGDFRATVLAAVRCGGDSDTTGAMAGAIAGTQAGATGLPEDWLRRLLLWPRSMSWMKKLAHEAVGGSDAAERSRLSEPRLAFQLVRNSFFTATVLGHGLRRLLPPY